MLKMSLYRFFFILTFFLCNASASSQTDSTVVWRKKAVSAYKTGNNAESLLFFQKIIDQYDASIHKEKDVLFALKNLIAISGMVKSYDLAEKYYNTYSNLLKNDFCNSTNIRLKIGVINNFIAVSMYNEEYRKGEKEYIYFTNTFTTCAIFNPIDLVQSSANMSMIYSEIGDHEKAIGLLPLVKHYKDSLPNWSSADFNTLLGLIESNIGENNEASIDYFKKSASSFIMEKKYAYAINLYELVLDNYGTELTNKELLEIIYLSNQVRDSVFSNLPVYKNMMHQLGGALYDKTMVQEKNNTLQLRIQYLVIVLLILGIVFVFYFYKKNEQAKNYYKSIYTLNQKIVEQNAKLSTLKTNITGSTQFIDSDKISGISNYFKQFDADFPQFKLNIIENFSNLTPKELQIMYCTVLGLSAKESADLLFITNGSYRVLKNRLVKKLNFSNADNFKKAILKLL